MSFMIDDHDIILDEKDTYIYLEDPYRIISNINHSIWVVQVNITIHHDTNGIFTICIVISHDMEFCTGIGKTYGISFFHLMMSISSELNTYTG